MPDVFEVAAEIGWPDYDSERSVARLLSTRPDFGRSAGRLGVLAQWLGGVQAQSPPRDPARVSALIVAADHGIAAAGVTTSTATDSRAALARVRNATAPVAQCAELVGARLLAVDVGLVEGEDDAWLVRRGTGRIDREDALDEHQVRAGFEIGIALTDRLLAEGSDVLVAGSLGAGATTPASTLIAVLTGTEPTKVTGRGSGIDDAAWMRKVIAIRDARRRGLPHRADPQQLLATVGGADIAVLAGAFVRAAEQRLPVLVDGVVAGAAALIAREIQPRCVRWLLAGPPTGEPAHDVVLRTLGLTPIFDVPAEEVATAGGRLGLALGDGSGALLGVPVLRAAARLVPVEVPPVG